MTQQLHLHIDLRSNSHFAPKRADIYFLLVEGFTNFSKTARELVHRMQKIDSDIIPSELPEFLGGSCTCSDKGDLLVFFPAVLWFVWAYIKLGVGISGEERWEGWRWLLAMVLSSPCLVLIDHGHFQCNCVSLGLALGAIAGVLSRNELVAADLFTLAINHKQLCPGGTGTSE
ncbi:putative dolichyl pyrophosphate Man9GlcNAc2 alpha-1,3-glucosyltransferase [Zea mays]|uniref:Alpha-1,3-glucosyltransferase n=1 Tax=Zea mays TaxID=4577 RepID=A0A3L6DGE5_MAIZE|nr:putative dolichyl pyrophosphate Man9GlcNAc2 alpha-1,3-glucosyltransferase [Zea mays]